MLVFGQDKAIDSLSEAIKMNRAGLGLENKPVGSFSICWSNRVGEVTVQLAKALISNCCDLICLNIWSVTRLAA